MGFKKGVHIGSPEQDLASVLDKRNLPLATEPVERTPGAVQHRLDLVLVQPVIVGRDLRRSWVPERLLYSRKARP